MSLNFSVRVFLFAVALSRKRKEGFRIVGSRGSLLGFFSGQDMRSGKGNKVGRDQGRYETRP